MHNNGPVPSAPSAHGELSDPDFAASLPRIESIPPGCMAFNDRGERIDAYMPPITAEDRNRFTKRTASQKLCNRYHLTGECPSFASGNACEFDHSPIDDGMRNYLRSIAASTPCTRRSLCRSLTCLNGHVCQKSDCKYRGGKLFCKLPVPLHMVRLGVKKYVSGLYRRSLRNTMTIRGRLRSRPRKSPMYP